MVSGKQDRRHLQTAIAGRPRVLRVFEQSLAERFIEWRSLIAEHPGDEADRGIAYHHGRQFAAGEHVVTERDAQVGTLVHAFIETLVVPADEYQACLGGQALCERLIEGNTRRCEEDGLGGNGRVFGALEFIERLEYGFAFHEQALTTAVGLVIGGAMTVMRPIAQVVRRELEESLALGDSQHGRGHGHVEHLGEDGEDIGYHRPLPSADAREAPAPSAGPSSASVWISSRPSEMPGSESGPSTSIASASMSP